jgi:hypothetical protein
MLKWLFGPSLGDASLETLFDIYRGAPVRCKNDIGFGPNYAEGIRVANNRAFGNRVIFLQDGFNF